MENSRNLLLLLVVIAFVSLMAWVIHNKKYSEMDRYLKEYHEYVINKYESGKKKLFSYFGDPLNK